MGFLTRNVHQDGRYHREIQVTVRIALSNRNLQGFAQFKVAVPVEARGQLHVLWEQRVVMAHVFQGVALGQTNAL